MKQGQIKYINNKLHMEGVDLSTLDLQTPFYIYSMQSIIDQTSKLKGAFSGQQPLICFAMKANSNLSILKLFASLGIGADTVSGAEIKKALMAGIPAEKIVFSGVGKLAEEISFAISKNIKQINAESISELHLIDRLAKEQGVVMPVAIRIKPEVDAKTHHKISTGDINSKFGVEMSQAADAFLQRHAFENLQINGISVHIGSQITELSVFSENCSVVKKFVNELREHGITIDNIDFGGGLGISYNGEEVIEMDDYAKLLCDTAAELNCQMILEPGRLLVAASGVLVTSLLYVKQTDVINHMVVDAGMNDLMRPALYKAKHKMVPLVKTSAKLDNYSIVGPVCESSDVFGGGVLPAMAAGERIAILDAGAYGFSLANNYNLRTRPAEYAIHGEKVALIRRREEFEDLLCCEEG